MIDDVAQSRIVQASPATLTFTLLNSDGEEPETADTSTITVGVVDAFGTEVIAAGTATTADDNNRTVALTRSQTASVNRLIATWSEGATVVGVTQHDIVGGVYFTIPELRAVPSASVADKSKHSDEVLIEDRTEVEYQFESVTRRAFVPRFATEQIRSHGGDTLLLRYPDLREVAWARYTTDGSTWTTITNVDRVQPNAGGSAVREGTCWPCGLIEVGYRYGWDRPTPEVKRAALTACRFRRHQDKSGVDPRVTSMQTEFGNLTLATPGVRSWVTGVPGVDEVLNRVMWKVPGVA